MAPDASLHHEELFAVSVARPLGAAGATRRLLKRAALARGHHLLGGFGLSSGLPAFRRRAAMRFATRRRPSRRRRRTQGLHVGHPLPKFLGLLRPDAIGHAGVLDPAEFTALGRILALDLRLEPKPGFAIGKDITLGRELRDPEAVNDIRTSHPEGHRPT